jgi:4-amino-4-deoxychorismate lyase
MCLLLESIKIENQKPVNLDYHQERAMKSRKQLFGVDDDFDIEKSISIPENLGNGIFKCRVLYGMKIERIEFEPYVPRKVNTLKLVFDDEVDYHLKYVDRSGLSRLFLMRGDCDDILIVKNGLVTDTSYSNILFLKKGRWYTPDKPLLEGTKRDYLIQSKKVIVRKIQVGDILDFEKFMLVNAMLDIDDNRAIEIQNIHY